MEQGERLLECKLLWSLRVGERLSGGHRSAVHEVVGPDGRDLVLKLCATSASARAEAAALRAWAGADVAVELLADDERLGALLLERLHPGTALPRGPEGVPVAAELLGTLHGRHPGDAPATVLLHGDLLTKNVLRHGDTYRVIDPLPRLGDPASDAGMFASGQPATAILETAEVLAGSLGLGPDRVVAWAVVWTVLQAAQAWRPDQDTLDALGRRTRVPTRPGLTRRGFGRGVGPACH